MLSGDTRVRPFGGQWGEEGASVSLALQLLTVLITADRRREWWVPGCVYRLFCMHRNITIQEHACECQGYVETTKEMGNKLKGEGGVCE